MKKILMMIMMLITLVASAFAVDITPVTEAIASSGSSGGGNGSGVILEEVNVLFAVYEEGPTSDVIVIVNAITDLKYQGYTIPIGNIKLFEDLNAEHVGDDYPITVAIYNGEAKVITGDDVIDISVMNAVEDALDNHNVDYETFSGSIIDSPYLINLFAVECADEEYSFCSSNSACTQITHYVYNGEDCVVQYGLSDCQECVVGCDSGECYDEDLTRDYNLYEGWNLLPIGEGIDFDGGSPSQPDFEDLIEAAYVWNVVDDEYVDLFTNEGEDLLEDIIDDLGYTAVWVYIADDMTLELEVDLQDVQETLENIDDNFEQGWNFYVALPQMYEHSPSGHFNFYSDYSDVNYLQNERVYAWDSYEWEFGHYTEITESALSDYDIGMPFLMNYVNDFTPHMQYESSPAVPDFPEGY